jgi:uncharacterized cofD-like protein
MVVRQSSSRKRRKSHPKVVAIGGGTGLSTLLRGVKTYTPDITAVVTVADDGGSSGRLRKEMGILPPGDIRNCIVALAEEESLMSSLFQYRFQQGEGLKGHSIGNLLIAALTDISGDFLTAIRQASKILKIKGKVYPSTAEKVVLLAELDNNTIVEGQSRIMRSEYPIKRVFLRPGEVSPIPEAVQALMEADQIIIGPGSLFTSIIPNLLIPDIAEAIGASRAQKIYICNVMTQPGETDGYRAEDHLDKLLEHCPGLALDIVIVNNSPIPRRLREVYALEGAVAVDFNLSRLEEMGVKVIVEDVANFSNFVRHDPLKLAKVLKKLAEPERSTPCPSPGK